MGHGVTIELKGRLQKHFLDFLLYHLPYYHMSATSGTTNFCSHSISLHTDTWLSKSQKHVLALPQFSHCVNLIENKNICMFAYCEHSFISSQIALIATLKFWETPWLKHADHVHVECCSGDHVSSSMVSLNLQKSYAFRCVGWKVLCLRSSDSFHWHWTFFLLHRSTFLEQYTVQ